MTVSFTLSEEWKIALSTHPELLAVASQVLSASEYVYDWGNRHPQQLTELFATQQFQQVRDDADIAGLLVQWLSDVSNETTLHRKLRQFRQQQMVRIIWRDLAGWADLAETMRDLSALADACIRQSLALLYEWQTKINGTPCDINGRAQYMLVMGMGKLGAEELNLSSDIDLIFTYPKEGQTKDGERTISNAEFFLQVGRKLIQALNNNTADGFVFRVDMRLRPFGDSGALASSFEAMEEYYQTQGREWERYAMIKARAITGNRADKKALADMLRPFIYRRYLDYGMFESLRQMKSMIATQLRRKGMGDNIKLGMGGIREIEFLGQVFQLIYGGRDRPLQQRPILTILDLLVERNMLSRQAGEELKSAYHFLRRSEHRIQAWADQQTHLLPDSDAARQRLASSMGYSDWTSYISQLQRHRDDVHAHFNQLLATTKAESDESDVAYSLLHADMNETQRFLYKWGYQNLQESAEVIEKLTQLNVCRNLSETGTQRLERLLPLLIQAAGTTDDPDECLPRLMPLLEAIMRRSAYMSLLVENPLALSQLVKLCAASVLISHQLARHPILLDELLDPRSLYEVPGKSEQARRLDHFLNSVDEDDLEQLMIRMREFRQIATLNVMAADVTGVLPLMRVGDQLTELAEIQLERVWRLAWKHLVIRHGYPPAAQSDDPRHCGFTILAYGKLGGLELGYGSDLDLIFIFDDSQQGRTDGEKPVDLMVFYTRLAQRMIHILNSVTSGGLLYEVDTRLRPNGTSGLLVSSLSGFSEYQTTDAWIWEHQALVRARCVMGDDALSEKVGLLRQQILAKPRDQQTLANEVSDMRSKMRGQLDKSDSQLFDLKQGKGGITDIEFLVQYAVLAWSANLPELLVYTDNIRILDAIVASGKLDPVEGEMLAEAYRYYRNAANHYVLQERPALIPLSQLADYPQQVTQIWQRWLGES